MGQAEFALRQNLQQIGHGAGKAHLDHAPGHCAHFADAGQVLRQGCALQPIDRTAQGGAGAFAGDRTAIGPAPIAQAEYITHAVGGNDPAVGQRWGHMPLGIHRHQPLGCGGAQHLRSQRQPAARFKRRGRIADHRQANCILIISAAAAKRQ